MSGIYDNSMFDSGETPDITTNTNVTSTDGNNTEAPNISGAYPQVDNGNTIILYTTRPGGNDNGNDSGNSDDDNNTGGGTGDGGYTDPDDPSTDTGSTTEYPGVTIVPTITLNAPSSNRTETFTNNSTIEISASGVNCSAIKAYVNGMLVCTAYGNSLSYTYPVNADGEYTVFVYGISSDDAWVASESYTVTFEAANIEGYFKIRNSAGKYLTYVTPVKNTDPISVADENNSDTQIWKIEASTETNKYHIKPALRNSHAVNIYRDGNYPCTMYKVAGNVADTSFTLESAQSNNYTIKWNDETDTRYLTCNGSGTYWAQTVNPQVWTFVPVSYTPPAIECYRISVKDKETGAPISAAAIYLAPRKKDITKNGYFVTALTDNNGMAEIPAEGEYEHLNYKSVGIDVHADGYADWVSPDTVTPSDNYIVAEMTSADTFPDFQLPFNSSSGPSRFDHQDFGWRYLEPLDYHTGIDFLPTDDNETTVKSICDGTIFYRGFFPGAGNYIQVLSDKIKESDPQYYITYMHLASINECDAALNEKIKKGQTIGTMSNTNLHPDPKETQNMGIHLHLSIATGPEISPAERIFIDPKAFLTF